MSTMMGFLPRGFLQMIYLDMKGFDRQHYMFDNLGREFSRTLPRPRQQSQSNCRRKQIGA
jgi:hypothetical protein